jgi:hypothetical protein
MRDAAALELDTRRTAEYSVSKSPPKWSTHAAVGMRTSSPRLARCWRASSSGRLRLAMLFEMPVLKEAPARKGSVTTAAL